MPENLPDTALGTLLGTYRDEPAPNPLGTLLSTYEEGAVGAPDAYPVTMAELMATDDDGFTEKWLSYLGKLSPAQYDLFRQRFAEMTKERVPTKPRGPLEKFRVAVRRGMQRVDQNLLSTLTEYVMEPLGMEGKLTRGAERLRDIENIRAGLDPIRSEMKGAAGWLANSFYEAAQMAPTIAPAAVAGVISPPSSIAYLATQTAPEVKDYMEEAGISESNSRVLSAVAAVPIAAVEYLQDMIMLPKPLRAPGKEFMAKTVRGLVLRASGRLAADYTVEIGEEFLQGVLQESFTKFGEWLEDKDKTRTWGDVVAEGRNQALAAAGPMMFMLGPGSVGSFMHDLGNIRSKAVEESPDLEARFVKAPMRFPTTAEEATAFVGSYPEFAKMLAERPTRQGVLEAVEEEGLTGDEKEAFTRTKRAEKIAGAKLIKEALKEFAVEEVEPTPAEEAAQVADARKIREQMHAGLPIPEVTEPVRPDKLPDGLKLPAAEEAIYAASKGIRKGGVREWIGKLGTSLVEITRPQRFIPRTQKFVVANEELRLYKETPEIAKDEAARMVGTILDPLGPAQADVFGRFLFFKDIQEGLRRIKEGTEHGEMLPAGMSEEVINGYVPKLEAAIAQTPELQQALASRQAIKRQVTAQLDRRGLLPEGADREWYYHRQSLEYARAMGQARRLGLKKVKQAFQKRRLAGVEAEHAYNTDYVQAEAAWLTQAFTAIRDSDTLATIAEHYDTMPQLRDKATKNGTTWREELAKTPGYMAWQQMPGGPLTPELSIPQALANDVANGILKEAKITASDLQENLSIVGMRTYVFPEEIGRQLNSMEKKRPRGFLDNLSRQATNSWKAWVTILNPKRFPQHMLRNFSGDSDAVFAAAPGVFEEVPGATAQMYDYFYGKRLALPEDVKNMRDYGVINATLVAKDIPSAQEFWMFKRLYSRDRTSVYNAPAKLAKGWYKTVRKLRAFEESLLRAAAYRYGLKHIKAGTLRHPGTANKAILDTIATELGPEAAAAHYSRNLVGDYGNMSVLGNWLRHHLIPFGAWLEINTKRYPALLINSLKLGQKKPIATALALKTAALARIGAFYTAQWAWNHLMFPDEEEKLPRDAKTQAHIILGKNPDGSVKYWRNMGALGDFLEWFGINTFFSLWPQYENGQISFDDMAKEMLKDPVNKMWQGIRPAFKGGVEVLTGQATFPDVMERRTAPRAELAAGIYGLTEEYRAARGALLGTGERVRPHYLQRFVSAVADQKRSALGEMHELRERFLISIGKPKRVISFGLSPARIMRYAAMNEDYEAFKDARRRYMEEGYTYDNFKRSIRYVDPIESRLSDPLERQFEDEFLTTIQKQKLRVAREYARHTEVTMWHWWNEAVREEEDAAVILAHEKQLTKEQRAIVRRLRIGFPRRKVGEPLARYQERVANYKMQRQRLLRRLKMYRER